MSVEQIIIEKLKENFTIVLLNVQNESHMHSVPKNSETHFKVHIVSDDFISQNRVERQRRVYKILDDQLKNGVHALSLRTQTNQEYEKTITSFESPQCASKSTKKN